MIKYKKKEAFELNNYKAVDIMKYAAAFMVICVHCNQITSNVYLDYFMNQILCRTAVPFFFVSSAYFVRRGMDRKPDYLKDYLRKLSKSYLVWSIIFIPIGLDWIHQNLTLSKELLPFALLFGLVHVGTYYHLWYIPGIIISLFIVNKVLKKASYKVVILISVWLFLFGSLETYYGILSDGWLKKGFDIIIQIFFTTRSGLLYGMVFATIGFFIYDYQEKLKSILKYVPIMTLISGILLVGEGILLYSLPKLDMNFLIFLIPFSFFFFLWILSLPVTIVKDTGKIRELSKYYYFVHTICIVMVEETGKALHIPVVWSGILSYLLIVLLTHVLSQTIIAALKQPVKVTFIMIGSFMGMCVTFIGASLVYALKPESIVIKFEFVPCLWVFASIAMYSLLCRSKRKRLDFVKGECI